MGYIENTEKTVLEKGVILSSFTFHIDDLVQDRSNPIANAQR